MFPIQELTNVLPEAECGIEAAHRNIKLDLTCRNSFVGRIMRILQEATE